MTGSNSLTVMQWLSTQSYEAQYRFGLQMMHHFGGPSGSIEVGGVLGSWVVPGAMAPFAEGTGFGQDEDEER